MTTAAPEISIIFPTRNESEITQKLSLLSPFLGERSFEILVVDDSSAEKAAQTRQEVESLGARYIFLPGPGKGKGAAVKAAANASKGKIVFMIDSDLRIPLENIPLFIECIERDGVAAVIAERSLKTTNRAPLRYFLSSTLRFLLRVFVFHSFFFEDTQCGFKAFRGDLIRGLARAQRIEGGMYDVEYLYLIRRARLRIAKVQVVSLPEIRQTKIRLMRCLAQDPLDLLRIKWGGLSGRYPNRFEVRSS